MEPDDDLQPVKFEAPSMDDLAPLFPAYELKDFIAQGGMGAVYRARQKSLDRPVAIKVLPREFGEDPVFRESFEAEAKAMARLNHSNLIGVYDFGEAGGMLFIVMEYVNGASLFHSARGRAIDPEQAASLVIAISRGLHHAHGHGILHRDIKAANILLDSDANPKIGDFGLARRVGDNSGDRDGVYGTPGFTAPEVVNQQPVDHRADIFSVGVLLHELLTGAPPDEKKTPPSVLSGCPRGFDAIVSRATQVSPAMRYASAGELADDLEKLLREMQSETRTAATRFNLPASGGAASPAPIVVRPAAPVIGAAAPRVVPGSGSSGKVAPAVGPLTKPVAPPLTRAVAFPPAKKSSTALIVGLFCLILALGAVAYILTRGTANNDAGRGEKGKRNKAQPTVEPTTSDNTVDPFTVGGESPAQPPDDRNELESAIDGLARLKAGLAAGKRTDFPTGTAVRNESYFLLLNAKLMNWNEAGRFAEAHGAHLAVLPTRDDRKWFQETFAARGAKRVWIGAGKAAFNRWQWIDDTPWDANTAVGAESTESDRVLALAMTPGAALAPAPPDENLAIALQWRKSGANPATLEAQLKRTAESIQASGTNAARYPVGTRTRGNTHYFYYPSATSWNDAKQVAESAGAHLAVPATGPENAWILNTFAGIVKQGHSFWIGGFRSGPGSRWQWLTGEPWSDTAWLPHQRTREANYIRIGRVESAAANGWLTADGAAGAVDGMLLEWSPKSKPEPAADVAVSFDLEKWLDGVHEKMRKRVEPDVEKHQKERKEIIAKYVTSMRRLGRKLDDNIPGGGRGRGFVSDLVDGYLETVEETGELIVDLPELAPREFQELHESTEWSLDRLDERHRSKIQSHLAYYIDGLRKKAADLAKGGSTDAADKLKESAKATIEADTATFLNRLEL